MTRHDNVGITLIIARARDGVIGNAGSMPWHSKTDLAFFRRNTLGHPVVMGRKTWDSLPVRPLPKRFNIVVSRAPKGATDTTAWCETIENALKLGRRLARLKQVYVIGGAEIYRLALPYADQVAITQMPFDAEGDTYFPDLNPSEWREERRFTLELVEAERQMKAPEVVVYERMGAPRDLD